MSLFKKYLDLFVLVPLLIGLTAPLTIKYCNNIAMGVLAIILLIIVAYLILNQKKILLYALVFSIPLSVPTTILGGSIISFPSEGICLLLAMFVIAKSVINLKISKDLLYHPITIIIILDIVWLIIASFASELKAVAFKRTAIHLMYIIVYYFMFSELFKEKLTHIYKVFLCLVLGMIFPIIYTTVFHSQFNFSTEGSVMASLPFYNDHTIYGAALAIVLPFLIYNVIVFAKNKKTWLMLLSILLLLFFCMGIFLSYSRAAWLSILLSLLLFIFIKLKFKLKTVVLFGMVASVAIVLSWTNILDYLQRSKAVNPKKDIGMYFKSVANVKTNPSNAERINRWKCAWRMFEERPIFGFGPGSYQFYYGNYQHRNDMTTISTFHGNKGRAHSDYMDYLCETGLFGAVNFLALIILTCYYGVKIIYKSNDDFIKNTTMYVLLGFCTYGIHAFFNGFIDIDKIAMPCYVCISAIVTMSIIIKNKNHSKLAESNNN